MKEIREKQSAGKSGRKELFDKISKLDAGIKTDIANQKTARSKVNFKSVDELDREIKRLEDQVNGGTMKIVDEKKALAEVSNLRKQRKGFSGFEDAQKSIDAKKAEVKKLRDTLDDPESKALSDKYNSLQAELDTIKAEQDEAFKSINTLRDERTKLQNEQQEKYTAIKTLKDNYYHQNKAVQKWDYESRQRQRERRKQEQEEYVKGKKKERAQQLLSEASDKAYLDEIRRAEAVLRFLDPTYTTEKAPLQAASKFAITNQRTVDDSGLKGTRVASKKDKEEDFFAAKPKSGKKGKKATTPAEPAAGKYSVPPAILEDCTALGVDPPMASSDIPSVIEKVKAKLDHWKSDQAAQTEKVNISFPNILNLLLTLYRTLPKPRRRLSVLTPRTLRPTPQHQVLHTPTVMERPLPVLMTVAMSRTRLTLPSLLRKTLQPISRLLASRTRHKLITHA